MCGIIGVVRRPGRRAVPAAADLTARLRAARDALDLHGPDGPVAALLTAADHVDAVDTALRGTAGVRALLAERAVIAEIDERTRDAGAVLEALERDLDAGTGIGRGLGAGELEALNAALVRCKDALWAVRRDRLRTAGAVADLAGSTSITDGAVEVFTSVQVALSAIDRLEVRGRDSAGLHLLVREHALDLADPTVAKLVRERGSERLFRAGAVRLPGGLLSVVYKAAAEIGELGDNVAALRAQIRDDALLHLALANDGAAATVLGHTRWASVGIISEANAHPLNQEEMEEGYEPGPYVTGALNGDVDNHADLRALEQLRIPPEITTDAKVIPALVSRRIAGGMSVEDAFRTTVASFEGSVAIAASAADAPDSLLLALRGSGQALYVGVAEDSYIVASEPYGLVEETSVYLRLDGETPANPDNPTASRGQIVVLEGSGAGTLEGISRSGYDGTRLPVRDDELAHAQITTRDIDRGDFPHFLLKEISEAPASFRKTLRGKLVESDDGMRVHLGDETLPAIVRERLRAGEVSRVLVIGQGTAAVAGQSLATALQGALGASRRVDVRALPATELSGFGLDDDMRDTLVIAISQSGTTTDTNRTVDLVRARGGAVVAIVNRRNSDLTDRCDGVLYTSDGRDVEMSVASTKAFYAQVAAGFLLAFAIAEELGADGAAHDAVLRALRELPDAMIEVLRSRPAIAQAAQRHAPARRYWAVVGNGANRIAANEVRIKLSELCYKSIACDATEDKKHIDLSAEPLILVCAAGLSGSNADDVAKELAIYRAHKAAPIAIADEGESRFATALETISVPAVHPALGFVLSAMAGHLFGYEAALAIDASALPLRAARAAIEAVAPGASGSDNLLDRLAVDLQPVATRFFDGLRTGAYDGSLEAATAVRLAALLRYAAGIVGLDAYQVEFGKVGTPSTVVEDLTAALTRAIEELTRPIDAIKHQAKTVTVGISRSDETLLQVRLVKEVLAGGVARDNLSYRALRTLVDLDAAVEQVTGFTRYRIEGDPGDDDATIHVVDRGGLGAQLPSRTESDPRLRGTKQLAAVEREVTVAKGRSDGRTVILVPEVKGNQTVGITLLHVHFHDRLAPDVARAVLMGYRHRYTALKGAVTEVEPTFADAVLADIDVADLLTEPVYVLAERWRTAS
ncbi:MAG TPA: SIS domain-containing protein [Acidimicrobiia bacterium]|jgi:glucosamine--fructose-6-phosphate aminotransferase (isomerizing)